ncbi:hypothetical protein E5K00_16460 [Hymenobacter aquaticus]|uniref:Uncharacterized protein n=1 Tax=Hymenobacter aquaticus TaxID=1867101 RepID=A0A4Z0PVV1_9BACT|nr:hypothetical protein [Hymenobacter aquaticus]TGE21857.1 hypothetical protein E5K00_16460 [Hymenobacter aquaticus]
MALKLLAWDDRPEQRGKDDTDLRLILQHYHALIETDIIERHYELLIAQDPQEKELMQMVGIRVLGQELQALVAVSPPLRTFLYSILIPEIHLTTTSRLALAMSQRISPTDKISSKVGQSQKWLQALATGLAGELLPPDRPTT